MNCRCSTRSLRQAETVSVGGLLGEDDEEEIQHLSACSGSSVVQLNALSNVVFRSTANEGRSKGRQDAGDIRSAVGGSGARGMRRNGE